MAALVGGGAQRLLDMNLVVVALLAVAAVLVWWVLHRSARLRRESDMREAKLLEALFAARNATGGGANIDVDSVFGGRRAADASTADDAVLRMAGLQSEIIEMLGEAPGFSNPAPRSPPGSGGIGDASPIGSAAEEADTGPRSAPRRGDVPAAGTPVAVRDLVQVFYEARGFRAVPAGPEARPIELVLAHKSDGHRSYAFAPLAAGLTEAAVQSIIEKARAIDQPRVLIAVEAPVAPGLAGALPTQGVRVFDRAAIEAQLARLDAGLKEKLHAAAQRRARQRLRGAS
jgi:hypothetical protein